MRSIGSSPSGGNDNIGGFNPSAATFTVQRAETGSQMVMLNL